jgi:hypothetical protein
MHFFQIEKYLIRHFILKYIQIVEYIKRYSELLIIMETQAENCDS